MSVDAEPFLYGVNPRAAVMLNRILISSCFSFLYSPLILLAVLLLCASRSPFTLPYSHCSSAVLTVMVNAAPANTSALYGVSSCLKRGYG